MESRPSDLQVHGHYHRRYVALPSRDQSHPASLSLFGLFLLSSQTLQSPFLPMRGLQEAYPSTQFKQSPYSRPPPASSAESSSSFRGPKGRGRSLKERQQQSSEVISLLEAAYFHGICPFALRNTNCTEFTLNRFVAKAGSFLRGNNVYPRGGGIITQ